MIKRFPQPSVFATEGTIEVMHRQATKEGMQFWDQNFPNQIPDAPVLAAPIPSEGFLLEGNHIVAIETGHTDTENTSVLRVPAIGLVVAVMSPTTYTPVHLRGRRRWPPEVAAGAGRCRPIATQCCRRGPQEQGLA
jgi:hypothetical protein